MCIRDRDKAAWVEIKGRGDNHTDIDVYKRQECGSTAGSGSTEDGSSCRGLEMQLRRSKHRQILCRMRSAQAC